MSSKATAKSKPRKIETSDDPWETGELGMDAQYAEVATDVDEAKIDRALDLVPVSIRLQKSLIEDYKYIAELNGLGYQTLMRQILTRFAESEKKQLLREAALKQRTLAKAEKAESDEHRKRA